MSWLVDVVKLRCTALLARVIYNQIPKSEDSLRNTGRNGYVLDLGQRYVSGFACNQPRVYLKLGISQCVPNHVPLDVEIGRNQQERERQGNRNVCRYIDKGEQEHERDGTHHSECIAELDKDHSRPHREDSSLELINPARLQSQVGL